MRVNSVITLVLVSALFYHASGEFTESPASQVVDDGAEAVFRCQHPTADIIRWRVNRSLISQRNYSAGFVTGKDESVNTLTITARHQYNGSEVVCVAQFDDGSLDEESSVAVLRVRIPTCSSDGFTRVPMSVNVAMGVEHTFTCIHPTAEALIWKVNGTSLRNLPALNMTFWVKKFGKHLHVTALSEYNKTSVECVALFSDAPHDQAAACPVMLQIQGHLDGVKRLRKEGSTVKWDDSPSLDLSNVDPDVTYCVDVYNVTCGERKHVISNCNVNKTSYTSTVTSDGYLYEYIVTPRSNINGALNGTPSHPLRDTLPKFVGYSTRLLSGKDPSHKSVQIEITYTQNMTLPSSYSLSFKSLDGLEDMDYVQTTFSVSTEQSLLILDVIGGLMFRRLWNYTILAYGCEEHGILSGELTTHDLQKVSLSPLRPGEVKVTGIFADGSTATGIFVIVAGDSRVYYHMTTHDRNDTIILTLTSGNYIISVFEVNEEGLPFGRVATSPIPVAVKTSVFPELPSYIEYDLHTHFSGVCIECTFKRTGIPECIAVVYERPTASSAVTKLKSSHRFTKSGNTASGCIEGVNLGDYQVGVIGGKRVATVVNLPAVLAGILGILGMLFVMLFVMLVSLPIAIVCWKRKMATVNASSKLSGDVEQGRPGCSPNAYVDLPQETTPLVEAVNPATVSKDQERPVPPRVSTSPCTSTEPEDESRWGKQSDCVDVSDADKENETSGSSSLSGGELADGSITQLQSQVEIEVENHELDKVSSDDHTVQPDKPSRGLQVISPSDSMATAEVGHEEKSSNILKPDYGLKAVVNGSLCAPLDENQDNCMAQKMSTPQMTGGIRMCGQIYISPIAYSFEEGKDGVCNASTEFKQQTVTMEKRTLIEAEKCEENYLLDQKLFVHNSCQKITSGLQRSMSQSYIICDSKDGVEVASEDNTEGSPQQVPAVKPHEKSGDQLSDSAYVSMGVSVEALTSKSEEEAPLSEADSTSSVQDPLNNERRETKVEEQLVCPSTTKVLEFSELASSDIPAKHKSLLFSGSGDDGRRPFLLPFAVYEENS